MDNKILKGREFKKVLQALWDKTKEKLISDIFLDTSTGKNVLKKNRLKGTTEDIIIPHIITKWNDLDYVNKYEYVNILDFSKKINGRSIDSNGKIEYNAPGSWGICYFDIIAEQDYTLIRDKQAHNVKIRFENESGELTGSFFNETPQNINGWYRVKFRTPASAVRGVVELEVGNSKEYKTMIIEGDQLSTNIPNANNYYIPYADMGKVKIDTNVSYSFNPSGTNLKSTTINSAIKEVIENSKESYVHLYNENCISAETTIVNGYILGDSISVLNNTSQNMTSMTEDGEYSGSPSMKADMGQYVGHISIGMDNNLAIGSIVTGVKVGVVNRDNNTVVEYLNIDNPISVQKNIYKNLITDTDRIITIPINKSWDDKNVWFILGAKGMLWQQRDNGMSDVSIGGNGNIPSVGTILSPNTSNYIGKVIIHGDKISLSSLINDEDNLKSINSQISIDGNIDLNLVFDGDNLKFKANNYTINNIPCMTDQEVIDIISTFV